MAKPIGPGLQAICLAVPNADRHTGRIRTAAAESAQALAKHQRDPSHARRTGRAWRLPRDGTGYGDRRSLRGLPRTGVRIRAARVRGAGPNLFETCSGRRASTAAGESPGSRSRSAESFLTRGRRATWLGCGRKYATLLDRLSAPAMSIASLPYFAEVIDEVVTHTHTSDTCWVLHPGSRGAGMDQLPSKPNELGGYHHRLRFPKWPKSAEWWPTSLEWTRKRAGGDEMMETR
jgi:hypothetical protein